MKLDDLQFARVACEHPDGWAWSPTFGLTRPQGIGPWQPVEVPADGWAPKGRTGLKPWSAA